MPFRLLTKEDKSGIFPVAALPLDGFLSSHPERSAASPKTSGNRVTSLALMFCLFRCSFRYSPLKQRHKKQESAFFPVPLQFILNKVHSDIAVSLPVRDSGNPRSSNRGKTGNRFAGQERISCQNGSAGKSRSLLTNKGKKRNRRPEENRFPDKRRYACAKNHRPLHRNPVLTGMPGKTGIYVFNTGFSNLPASSSK